MTYRFLFLPLALIAGATPLLAQPAGGPGGRASGSRLDPAFTAERLVERFDADGSGELSVDELEAVVTKLRSRRGSGARPPAPPAPPAPPEGAGSGYFGPRLDPEQRTTVMLALFDADEDGKLSRDELLQAMEEKPGRGRQNAASSGKQ